MSKDWMGTLTKSVQLILKGFALLIGGILLLGGGICAVSGIVSLPFNGIGFIVALLVLGVSISSAWLGWRLIGYTGVTMALKAGKKEEATHQMIGKKR